MDRLGGGAWAFVVAMSGLVDRPRTYATHALPWTDSVKDSAGVSRPLGRLTTDDEANERAGRFAWGKLAEASIWSLRVDRFVSVSLDVLRWLIGRIESGEIGGESQIATTLNPIAAGAMRDAERGGAIESEHGETQSIPSSTASELRFSKDYRSANWKGQVYDFTPSQAAAVQRLHEAWLNGTPSLADETLIQAAGVERYADLFKKHPAKDTLIVTGRSKGTHRLAPEPPRIPS